MAKRRTVTIAVIFIAVSCAQYAKGRIGIKPIYLAGNGALPLRSPPTDRSPDGRAPNRVSREGKSECDRCKNDIGVFLIYMYTDCVPHLRDRHLYPVIKKALSYSPLVGMLGHRQVGKTTLLEMLCKRYETLDKRTVLNQISVDPGRFLKKFETFPVALDECQFSPEIFPALKDHVRVQRRPGQFLLSGSVRFTSRKAIRESLTGRILMFELFPMTATEIAGMPLGTTLIDIFRSKSNKQIEGILTRLSGKSSRSLDGVRKSFRASMTSGGLPGVCFIRDVKMRRLKWESQLETILERDLELISETTLSYGVKRYVLSELARRQGQPLDYKELSRKTRVSVPALRKLLLAFEGLFLIRFIPSEGGEKRPTLFLEDQGEAQHLTDFQIDEYSLFTNCLYMHLRTPFQVPLGTLESSARLAQYRTRGGAYVPFAFFSGSSGIGVVPSLEENPSRSLLGSSKSFLDTFPNSKVVIIHPYERFEILGENLVLLPDKMALL